MTKSTYESLLKRLQDKTGNQTKKSTSRIELPNPDVMWVGKNKTIFRNFGDFPKVMRRDPEKVLLYLAKEFGSAAYIAGEKGIFVGKKEPSQFLSLFERYMKDYVMCPVCNSPDTKIDRVKRMGFLVCEACGAKSSIKGIFA
ncbi:MAG TPA: translation initiation factor IF-2 [Nitrososphaerales archaeon]|nr:translation initiation factor IF-2 [Nitrososphaerales archaeon]